MNAKTNKVVTSISASNSCITSRLIVSMDHCSKDLKLVIFICKEVDHRRRVNLKETIYLKTNVKITRNDTAVFQSKNSVSEIDVFERSQR